MEDQSTIIFEPPNEEMNQSMADFNHDEIINNPNFNKDDLEDFQEIIKLFSMKKPIKKDKNENIISKFKDVKKNSDKKLNWDDDFEEKVKIFLLRAYKLICADNEQNELIDKDSLDENSDNNDEENFVNILKKFIENEKENYEMNISIKNEKCTFNEKYFNINLYDIHKVHMCNDLLKMKIKIKLEIIMSKINGNVEIKFHYMKIYYNHKNQTLELKPNLKCRIINNILGKKGITYCTCGNCFRCEQKKIKYNFPFDDLLFYLQKRNKINPALELTYLYFKGCNSYKNDSNYKCSFCVDFYAKKSNIVRLFCNKEIDPEHTCQFWICRNCFYQKFHYGTDEICPNCKKFKVNFSKLKSYYNWKMMKNDKI
jgi:hypothetical protein